MKLIALLLSIVLLGEAVATGSKALAAEEIKRTQTITRASTQASIKVSAEYFTGNVRVDPLFAA